MRRILTLMMMMKMTKRTKMRLSLMHCRPWDDFLFFRRLEKQTPTHTPLSWLFLLLCSRRFSRRSILKRQPDINHRIHCRHHYHRSLIRQWAVREIVVIGIKRRKIAKEPKRKTVCRQKRTDRKKGDKAKQSRTSLRHKLSRICAQMKCVREGIEKSPKQNKITTKNGIEKAKDKSKNKESKRRRRISRMGSV